MYIHMTDVCLNLHIHIHEVIYNNYNHHYIVNEAMYIANNFNKDKTELEKKGHSGNTLK